MKTIVQATFVIGGAALMGRDGHIITFRKPEFAGIIR